MKILAYLTFLTLMISKCGFYFMNKALYVIKIFILFCLLITSMIAKGQEVKMTEFKNQLELAILNENYGKASFYSYEIGKLLANQAKTKEAITYLSQTITYGNDAEDRMLVYLGYQRLGVLYMDLENYNKALNNFQKALKVARETGKKEFINDGLIDVAINYAMINRHKRSISPLEEAVALSIQLKDDDTELQCYELLSKYHEKLGNKNKVVEYTSLIEKIAHQKINDEQNKQQIQALAEEVEKVSESKEEELFQTNKKLNRQSSRLRNAEDNLLAVKYSLEETEDLLKYKEDSLNKVRRESENQRLQINLLSKDKDLADLQIKEQEARLENAALIRNFIMVAILMAGSLVFVMIRSYRKKIESNKEIDRQNQKINGSINYAKRIQEAMLHNSDLREQLLPDSFILFKPRDSVSGDFYFISEIKSWYDPDIVIAAVDCTGHGIPGAFMSMIGMNSLNQIISQGVAESDQILDQLDKNINSSLQQESSGNKDGMDVALCIYRKEKGIIEFSGAKNPLIYIQNNELIQIKGDVHPIGGPKRRKKKKDIKKEFKKHIVPIDQPTMIYLFSDGYQDQFGGDEGMKFMSKRFKNLLLEIHKKPVAEQEKILNQAIMDWKGETKQTDDILVIGIRLDGDREMDA